MPKKRYLWTLTAVVVITAAVTVGSSGQGETCGPPHSCNLSASCTSCQVGQTITFSMDCTQSVQNPEEECPFPFRSCCEDTTVFPDPVYYTGTDPDGSSPGCVSGSNPLTYTFQPGDEGTYTRKACVFANCSNCSNTLTITVQ